MGDLEIQYKNKNSKNMIVKTMIELLRDVNNAVILCIGTDRLSGDSLPPLVGTFIENRVPVPVFGTLENPVHAKNLIEVYEHINKKYNNPFVITICGAIGKKENVGIIRIIEDSVEPGKALNKNLGRIGNISISPIINYSFVDIDIVDKLRNTSMNMIFNMSKIIANGIIEAFYEY